MSRFCDVLMDSGDHAEGYYFFLSQLTIAAEAMESESMGAKGVAAAIVDIGADDPRQHTSTLVLRDHDVIGAVARTLREWIVRVKGPLYKINSEGEAKAELSRQEFNQIVQEIGLVGKILRRARKDAAGLCGNSSKAAKRYRWLIIQNEKFVQFLKSLNLDWTWDKDGKPWGYPPFLDE